MKDGSVWHLSSLLLLLGQLLQPWCELPKSRDRRDVRDRVSGSHTTLCLQNSSGERGSGHLLSSQCETPPRKGKILVCAYLKVELHPVEEVTSC